MKSIRIALCQINPTVGDLRGNTEKIIDHIGHAAKYCPDIIAFPELAVTGYPPEDLLLKPQFIRDNLSALEEIRESAGDALVIVGFVDRRDDIYNAAALLHRKRVVDIYHKIHLPNYSVFDEYRYFQSGTRCPVYRMEDITFGFTICEDIWFPEGPAAVQALAGAEVIININASPYSIGKPAFRERMIATRAADNSVIAAYLNTVGGQDELVFDGQSFVADQNGDIIARGRAFEEDMVVVDLDLDAVFMRRLHDPRRRQQVRALPHSMVERITVERAAGKPRGERPECPARIPLSSLPHPGSVVEEEVYQALVLGTRDYVRKNGFEKVCIGLSGGVDSSLVATVAVDAAGAENVTGIFMPSPYSSRESREDAEALARTLGIRMLEVPITPAFEAYLAMLEPEFRDMPANEAEENLQARIRGNILMALSNKFGWLVLTTGNKSEMSVGYATLYGDMAGGFAVIKDVPKVLVYRLCRWKNRKEGRDVIPERVLVKEPTAELRPNQKDTDSLPPYDILDPILKAYIEEDRSFGEIVGLNPDFSADRIARVIRMVDTSEYKRRQAPPGVKITPRAFGRDRRFPITSRYKSY
ncbi:MAG: NAD+ synthase [Nitrospirota bacterium]